MYLLILICFGLELSSSTFISLRDEEFTGEDKVLAAALAERMPTVEQSMMQVTAPPAPDEDLLSSATDFNLTQLDIDLGPDVLDIKGHGPVVNVSMDYGEVLNAPGNWSLESEVWQPPSARDPAAAQLALERMANLPLFNDTRRQKEKTQTPKKPGDPKQHGQHYGGKFWDLSYYEINDKILDLMRQAIYSVQGRLIDVEPIVRKYEMDQRFRMAYMFARMDNWLRDLRRYHYRVVMIRKPYEFKFTDFLFHYSHMLRLNIDITYTAEYLAFLHGDAIEKTEKVLPREALEKLRVEQAKLKIIREKLGQ